MIDRRVWSCLRHLFRHVKVSSTWSTVRRESTHNHAGSFVHARFYLLTDIPSFNFSHSFGNEILFLLALALNDHNICCLFLSFFPIVKNELEIKFLLWLVFSLFVFFECAKIAGTSFLLTLSPSALVRKWWQIMFYYWHNFHAFSLLLLFFFVLLKPYLEKCLQEF